MAKIKEVVDECLAIATAFTSINSQTYNEIGAINFEDNDKSYPMFLFNKRNVEVVVDSYSRNNLPRKSTYSCNLIFVNTYTEAEKLTTDLQTKQDSLIDIASQYFAELRSKNASGENGFYLGDITFNSLDEAHSDNLIQLSYNVQFIANLTDCTLGTFNY